MNWNTVVERMAASATGVARARDWPAGEGRTAFKYLAGMFTAPADDWVVMRLDETEIEVGDVSATLGTTPQVSVADGIYCINIRCSVGVDGEETWGATSPLVDVGLRVDGEDLEIKPTSFQIVGHSMALSTHIAIAAGAVIQPTLRSHAGAALTVECREFSGYFVGPYEPPPPLPWHVYFAGFSSGNAVPLAVPPVLDPMPFACDSQHVQFDVATTTTGITLSGFNASPYSLLAYRATDFDETYSPVDITETLEWAPGDWLKFAYAGPPQSAAIIDVHCESIKPHINFFYGWRNPRRRIWAVTCPPEAEGWPHFVPSPGESSELYTFTEPTYVYACQFDWANSYTQDYPDNAIEFQVVIDGVVVKRFLEVPSDVGGAVLVAEDGNFLDPYVQVGAGSTLQFRCVSGPDPMFSLGASMAVACIDYTHTLVEGEIDTGVSEGIDWIDS